MASINEYNRHLYDHRMKGNYQAAISYYKDVVHKNISIDDIKAHPYLLPNLLHCLRKNGQESEALVFIEKKLDLDPGSDIREQWTFEIGWTLFQVLKKIVAANNNDASIDPYSNLLKCLLRLSAVTRNDLLWSKLVVQGTTLATRTPKNADDWTEFLLEFNPVDISSKPLKIHLAGKEKSKPAASAREQYFMQVTKALFAAGKFAECVEQCKRALKLVDKFHNGNQLWLSRRMALSLGSLGNQSEAIEGMKSLLSRKDEWFIRAEIGSLYHAQGNHAEALAWHASAALQGGHSAYKVGLYQSAGELCRLVPSHSALATQHFRLALVVRDEKGWKVPEELFKRFSKDDNGPISSAMIYEGLISAWQELSQQVEVETEQSEDVTKGKVTRILNEGVNGDGFITSNEGISIYFRMKRLKGPKVLDLGNEVICSFFEREYNGRKVLNARWVKNI